MPGVCIVWVCNKFRYNKAMGVSNISKSFLLVWTLTLSHSFNFEYVINVIATWEFQLSFKELLINMWSCVHLVYSNTKLWLSYLHPPKRESVAHWFSLWFANLFWKITKCRYILRYYFLRNCYRRMIVICKFEFRYFRSFYEFKSIIDSCISFFIPANFIESLSNLEKMPMT